MVKKDKIYKRMTDLGFTANDLEKLLPVLNEWESNIRQEKTKWFSEAIKKKLNIINPERIAKQLTFKKIYTQSVAKAIKKFSKNVYPHYIMDKKGKKQFFPYKSPEGIERQIKHFIRSISESTEEIAGELAKSFNYEFSTGGLTLALNLLNEGEDKDEDLVLEISCSFKYEEFLKVRGI